MSTRTRRFKDGIYEQVARLGKAVAAPKRLELLELLAQGPRTVEALAAQASVSIANASRHLQVLRGARLVEARKHGLYVEYRLAGEDVGRFLLSLRQLAESRLAEIEQATRAFFESSGTLEVVQGEDLLRRVKSGEVTVLDRSHVPGALSVPVAELEAQIRHLRRDRDVVAYCRGPYCVMAAEAVELLRSRGFTAHRMEQGVPDWRARGWRVETAAARMPARQRARAAR